MGKKLTLDEAARLFSDVFIKHCKNVPAEERRKLELGLAMLAAEARKRKCSACRKWHLTKQA